MESFFFKDINKTKQMPLSFWTLSFHNIIFSSFFEKYYYTKIFGLIITFVVISFVFNVTSVILIWVYNYNIFLKIYSLLLLVLIILIYFIKTKYNGVLQFLREYEISSKIKKKIERERNKDENALSNNTYNIGNYDAYSALYPNYKSNANNSSINILNSYNRNKNAMIHEKDTDNKFLKSNNNINNINNNANVEYDKHISNVNNVHNNQDNKDIKDIKDNIDNKDNKENSYLPHFNKHAHNQNNHHNLILKSNNHLNITNNYSSLNLINNNSNNNNNNNLSNFNINNNNTNNNHHINFSNNSNSSTRKSSNYSISSCLLQNDNQEISIQEASLDCVILLNKNLIYLSMTLFFISDGVIILILTKVCYEHLTCLLGVCYWLKTFFVFMRILLKCYDSLEVKYTYIPSTISIISFILISNINNDTLNSEVITTLSILYTLTSMFEIIHIHQIDKNFKIKFIHQIELIKEKEVLDSTLNNLNSGVMIVGFDNQILYTNSKTDYWFKHFYVNKKNKYSNVKNPSNSNDISNNRDCKSDVNINNKNNNDISSNTYNNNYMDVKEDNMSDFNNNNDNDNNNNNNINNISNIDNSNNNRTDKEMNKENSFINDNNNRINNNYPQNKSILVNSNKNINNNNNTINNNNVSINSNSINNLSFSLSNNNKSNLSIRNKNQMNSRKTNKTILNSNKNLSILNYNNQNNNSNVVIPELINDREDRENNENNTNNQATKTKNNLTTYNNTPLKSSNPLIENDKNELNSRKINKKLNFNLPESSSTDNNNNLKNSQKVINNQLNDESNLILCDRDKSRSIIGECLNASNNNYLGINAIEVDVNYDINDEKNKNNTIYANNRNKADDTSKQDKFNLDSKSFFQRLSNWFSNLFSTTKVNNTKITNNSSNSKANTHANIISNHINSNLNNINSKTNINNLSISKNYNTIDNEHDPLIFLDETIKNNIEEPNPNIPKLYYDIIFENKYKKQPMENTNESKSKDTKINNKNDKNITEKESNILSFFEFFRESKYLGIIKLDKNHMNPSSPNHKRASIFSEILATTTGGELNNKEDNGFLYIEVSMKTVNKSQIDLKFVEFFFKDVSRYKLVEIEKAEIKSKTTFMAKIAHEFKNPLICIGELTEQMKEVVNNDFQAFSQLTLNESLNEKSIVHHELKSRNRSKSYGNVELYGIANDYSNNNNNFQYYKKYEENKSNSNSNDNSKSKSNSISENSVNTISESNSDTISDNKMNIKKEYKNNNMKEIKEKEIFSNDGKNLDINIIQNNINKQKHSDFYNKKVRFRYGGELKEDLYFEILKKEYIERKTSSNKDLVKLDKEFVSKLMSEYESHYENNKITSSNNDQSELSNIMERDDEGNTIIEDNMIFSNHLVNNDINNNDSPRINNNKNINDLSPLIKQRSGLLTSSSNFKIRKSLISNSPVKKINVNNNNSSNKQRNSTAKYPLRTSNTNSNYSLPRKSKQLIRKATNQTYNNRESIVTNDTRTNSIFTFAQEKRFAPRTSNISDYVVEKARNIQENLLIKLMTVKSLSAYIINLVFDFEVLAKKESASNIKPVKAEINIKKEIEFLHELSVVLMKKSSLNVKFSSEIDQTIPDNITTDSLRLRQILINLISNSIKFTHFGIIKLIVKRITKSNDNDINNNHQFIQFEISDTGMGISNPSSLFNKNFNKFNGKSNHYGTGLGLMIVKDLCVCLGGDIKYEKNIPKGSKFIVTIPLETPPEENAYNPDQTIISESEEENNSSKSISLKESENNLNYNNNINHNVINRRNTLLKPTSSFNYYKTPTQKSLLSNTNSQLSRQSRKSPKSFVSSKNSNRKIVIKSSKKTVSEYCTTSEDDNKQRRSSLNINNKSLIKLFELTNHKESISGIQMNPGSIISMSNLNSIHNITSSIFIDNRHESIRGRAQYHSNKLLHTLRKNFDMELDFEAKETIINNKLNKNYYINNNTIDSIIDESLCNQDTKRLDTAYFLSSKDFNSLKNIPCVNTSKTANFKNSNNTNKNSLKENNTVSNYNNSSANYTSLANSNSFFNNSKRNSNNIGYKKSLNNTNSNRDSSNNLQNSILKLKKSSYKSEIPDNSKYQYRSSLTTKIKQQFDSTTPNKKKNLKFGDNVKFGETIPRKRTSTNPAQRISITALNAQSKSNIYNRRQSHYKLNNNRKSGLFLFDDLNNIETVKDGFTVLKTSAKENNNSNINLINISGLNNNNNNNNNSIINKEDFANNKKTTTKNKKDSKSNVNYSDNNTTSNNNVKRKKNSGNKLNYTNNKYNNIKNVNINTNLNLNLNFNNNNNINNMNNLQASPINISNNINNISNLNNVNNNTNNINNNNPVINKLQTNIIFKKSYLNIEKNNYQISNLPTITILVIDDEAIIRQSSIKVIEKYYTSLGKPLELTLIEASDGIEALYTIYWGLHNDIMINHIFTDDSMKFMEGNEFVKLCQDFMIRNKFYDIDIYVISAYEVNETKRKYQFDCVKKVFSKPISTIQLNSVKLN